jgi:tetratricopeptide (TPR) repeat protein
MSEFEPQKTPGEFACPYSAGTDLDRALARAESLARGSDTEAALELLRHVERRYIDASRVFDLLGDVLLKRGEIERGVRYKTLHQILRGTFKIALEEAGPPRSPREVSDVPSQNVAGPVGEEAVPTEPLRGPGPTSWTRQGVDTPEKEFIPITTAMAREFMRQGHYEKAFDIYNRLLAKSPDDEELTLSRERARQKGREKKLVGILNRWLANIDQIKTVKSQGL